MTTLRLFPLSTVLFPKMTLPLQIFEERYMQLVNECIDENEAFGVVSIKSGNEVGEILPEIYKIGTTAKINKTLFDRTGMILIEAIGIQRFEILDIISEEPFLTANIKLLDEINSVDENIFSDISKAYKEFIQFSEIASGSFAIDKTIPNQSGELADSIAVKAITFWDKKQLQKILEELDATSRLNAVKPIMDTILPYAKKEAKEKIRKLKSESSNLN
jgi:Lon protease-like protein